MKKLIKLAAITLVAYASLVTVVMIKQQTTINHQQQTIQTYHNPSNGDRLVIDGQTFTVKKDKTSNAVDFALGK